MTTHDAGDIVLTTMGNQIRFYEKESQRHVATWRGESDALIYHPMDADSVMVGLISPQNLVSQATLNHIRGLVYEDRVRHYRNMLAK